MARNFGGRGTGASSVTSAGASRGLRRPAAVSRYRPSQAQRRFLTTRDRTCRHPGCGNSAGWADLDQFVTGVRPPKAGIGHATWMDG